MTWRLSGDKPLSEPMMVSLPTHICVTRPHHWRWALGRQLSGSPSAVYRGCKSPDLAKARPPSPISCRKDRRLSVTHHCGQIVSIDHMLLECAVLQECRDEYYTAGSLNTLLETIPETCIEEFLQEAGFFCLILMVRHSIQFITWITPDLMEFVNFN